MIEMTSHTITEKMYSAIREDIASIRKDHHLPHLAIVMIGNDANSETYVAIKQKRAEELGIDFTLHHLDESTSQETVLHVIDELNTEPTVSGIIVQLPLPEHLDTDKILEAVVKQKDVDGLRPDSPFIPPTVQAILELLHAYDIVLRDKKIVIVGKGRLVGGPLLKELQDLKLDVTACDESVPDLTSCTLNADILISATGEAHLIQPSMVKNEAVIIDVDCDVDYTAVAEKASYITPQKGSVGPLTVAFLLANVVEAAKQVKVSEGKDEAEGK